MDISTVIATGLVTIIGSGLGSALMNYLLAERKAKRELKRTKLEELFLSTRDYGDIHRAALVRFHGVMEGKLPFQEAEANYDKVGAERSETKMRWRIQMLIDFYFSELRPELDNLITARRSAFNIFLDFRKAHSTGQPIAVFAAPFWDALQHLADQETALCSKAAGLAKPLLK